MNHRSVHVKKRIASCINEAVPEALEDTLCKSTQEPYHLEIKIAHINIIMGSTLNASTVHQLSPRSSNESLRSYSSATSCSEQLVPPVSGPMVWKGKDLSPAKYIIQLSGREIQDIRAAVIKVKSESSIGVFSFPSIEA